MENSDEFVRLLSENLNTQHILIQHTLHFANVPSETAKYILLTFKSASRDGSAF